MFTNRYVLILILWIALGIREVFNIYSTPDVFYSQFCSLNSVSAWSGNTFNCPATVAQSNIIRAGMALVQHSKHQYLVSEYTASLTSPGTSATAFTINHDIKYPGWLWMRLSFFIVIIKTQTVQKYIDLIPFNWKTDSTINNNQATDRTVTATLSVTTLTIFTSGTAGLQLVPFTTSFIMFPPYSWGAPIQDVDIQFRLSAALSGNDAIVSLTAYSKTKIQQFIGIVVVYNPPQVAVGVSKNWHIAFLNSPYSMGSSVDLSTLASAFGPNYDNKCILGIQRYKHETNDKAFYSIGLSYWGFYDQFKGDVSSAVVLEGYFFCFGNKTQCGQNATHWDKMDGDCYHPTLCPLPVPSGWTVANTCPNCTQLICLNCTVNNRSNCLSCQVNSTLVNGKCVCNTNYYEVNTTISTSTQGQWNNVANSLTQCLFNCTIVIPKCQPTSCTNDTFCNACMAGYLLNPKAPDQQNCLNCSQAIPHCQTCTVLTACVTCQAGYYVLTDTGQCDLCINKMQHCFTCTDNTTCLTCQTGYKVNSTTKLCQCDVTANKLLTNCLTCTSPTICTSCTNNSYYLDSVDNLCHVCSTFDLMCLQCSAKNVCTLCQTGYTIKSNTGGTATCVLCSLLMSQCSTCSSPTICTECNTFYGVTATNQCKICNQLIAPECKNCQDYSSCSACEPQNVLIGGGCQKCNEKIYKCRLCDRDQLSNVRCLKCQKSYYSSGTDCITCLNLFNFCNDCTINQCLNCISPYVLGPEGKCNQCIEGYWFVSGLCMNIPGCVMSTSLTNGSSICIACAQQLNFVYDKRNKKCICAQGFIESYQFGQMMSCVPVCGDGILSSSYEQCDDQNIQSSDGCDSMCKVQKDFKCTTESPSKCILSLNFSKIEFNYISRVLGKNKGIMSFSIEPNHSGLSKMDWSKLMKFNFPPSTVDQSQLTFSYSYNTGQLLVTVLYNQELENFDMSAIITFDPKFLISEPPTFYLGNKLNGINAPLVFENQSTLATTKNINLISSVLIGLLLLQFYLGSYFHKMIGLQTIQVIQSIYFVRMISTSASTSMLNSMNVIQYSACGYENAEIFYGQLQDFNTQSMGVIASQFNAINMKQFFLFNVNISLIPVILALILYGYSLARKYYSRNKYVQTKEQQEKDKYKDLRRKSQWVYDHFFFPFVMMFNLISFFFIVQELTKQQKNSINEYIDNMHVQSFPAHLILTFLATGIYCYEAISSAENNIKYRMTLKEKEKIPVSTIEKLQHDENNTDRANYHPAYVLVYLIYYLMLSIVMILGVLIDSFQYSLEMTIGLTTGYLILIWIWKPYHESINIHNHFLKLYYCTFVTFLVICYLFSKVGKLSQNLYIVMMYMIMVLIAVILVIGFVRIVIEKLYRAKLQNDNSILQWKSRNQVQGQNQPNKQNKKMKQSSIRSPTKKQVLMINNSYVFENQLTQLGKKYGFIQKSDQKPQLIKNRINKKKLSQQQENFIRDKIQEQIKQKRQKLILDQLVDSFLPNEKYQHQQPIVNKLTQKYDPPFIPKSNPNQKSKNINKTPITMDEQKQLTLLKLKLKNQWITKRF